MYVIFCRLAQMMTEMFKEPPLTRKKIYDPFEILRLERLIPKLGEFFKNEFGIDGEIIAKLTNRFPPKYVCPHCMEQETCPVTGKFSTAAGAEEGPDIVDILIQLGLLKPVPGCSCVLCQIVTEKIAQGQGPRSPDEVFKSLGVGTTEVGKRMNLSTEFLGRLSSFIRGTPQA